VANGLDLQKLFQWVNNELEWGEYHPPTHSPAMRNNVNNPRSMKSLWDDLVSIIPYSDYLFWFLEQYAINPDMQLLIGRQGEKYSYCFIIVTMLRLQAKSTENIRDHLHTCEEYMNYRCWFIGEGIELVQLEEKGCSFLEWTDCSYPSCG
jgi:hypothetical protein